MDGVASARRKVKRAQEHLNALQDYSFRHISDQSIFIIEESEGEKNLRFIKEPPIEIAILAGEIVYQLRSAMDHLAFELVKSNPTNFLLPSKWEESSEFPLFLEVPVTGSPRAAMTGEQLYERFRKRCLPGITKTAFALIESLQPYNGGDGPTQLGWLVKLAKIDKHRHFHIVNQQAYQGEVVQSSRINSSTLLRLKDGAKILPNLHSVEDLAGAVYVDGYIDSPFISFEETALPKDVADVSLDEVLEICMRTIERRVIPAIEKLINSRQAI